MAVSFTLAHADLATTIVERKKSAPGRASLRPNPANFSRLGRELALNVA
jgi:hypothetical protein